MKSAKPIGKPEIIVQDLGAETLLYTAEAAAVHILNPTAQRIWELCDGQHTLKDMEQVLRASFFISEEHDLSQDIEQTLALFAEKGLLQPQT